ncbi:hypothetical protein Q31b_10610 [Novipirellula aureliae]|uniref:Alpha/beta hydrolase family protein n=1 Tax=Novipirellula aureliae TaxID=2527966 RepID=A0A5C6EBM4_9BACT|nr:hypothetical protein [Novipirellula aureliae]TWU45885.1 hypothetical protein Q31b_10610 [Novipirellula aureliae]
MHSRRVVRAFLFLALLLPVSGCRCARSDKLQPPPIAKAASAACWYDWWLPSNRHCTDGIDDFEAIRLQVSINPTAGSAAVLGEKAYALAESLHADGDDRAIDYWARSIAWMDDALRYHGGGRCHSIGGTHCGSDDDPMVRASQIRQSAMTRILTCGQAYGRLDPASHLLINGWSQTFRIPITHQGFAWDRNDFDRVLVFNPPLGALGNVCGRGVPMVVLTPDKSREQSPKSICDCVDVDGQTATGCHRFLKSRTPFAATALIHLPVSLFEDSTSSDNELCDGADVPSVTFVNSLAIDPNEPNDRCNTIAQSPAMPLMYAREASQYNPIAAFVSGDNGVDRPELRFLEPYQADKIPLILVHGLISDPATFLKMADAVRADPLLRTRYQIWVFRYPTGDDFLESAAVLREQLAIAFACHGDRAGEGDRVGGGDHAERNLAQNRAVIVGHSLGGLLSKLQVTDSGDRLWQSIADAPLEQLRGPPNTIANLRRSFFCNANPNIGRVIYIATPHQGSPWASRCIGRLASSLVDARKKENQDYREIFANNPGIFSGAFSDASPTSIDLLRPSSRLLQSLASTPSSPDVAVNSIIGDHCRLPRSGPSDGVVAVDSAYRSEAESTTIVDATHTSILRSADAQQELRRILRLHLSMPTVIAESSR